jgi:hypothetical protein
MVDKGKERVQIQCRGLLCDRREFCNDFLWVVNPKGELVTKAVKLDDGGVGFKGVNMITVQFVPSMHAIAATTNDQELLLIPSDLSIGANSMAVTNQNSNV